MKLPVNPFLKAIRNNEPQIGIWVSLGNGYAAEAVAGAGFDWALIDMEHTPSDLTNVLAQLQAFAAYDTTAIVRPPWNDTVQVKRLLDTGAQGLLFPMVQSVQEAEKAVSACRYPPRGVRGVAGATRATQFGRYTDYYQRVEEETAIIVQLETREALALADDISAVEGIDAVFFGPGDIAADIGRLGQPMHEEVWDLIMPIAKRLIANNIRVSTLTLDPVFGRKLFDEGFHFVACGLDSAILARGVDAVLKTVKG